MIKENSTRYGWICPRCGKVNSPYKDSCDCTENPENEPFLISITQPTPTILPQPLKWGYSTRDSGFGDYPPYYKYEITCETTNTTLI